MQSRHFMTSPEFLLFVQVKRGPLYSRSRRLQELTKSLKMDKHLQLGGEQLRLSCWERISLKSSVKSHGNEGLGVMEESSFQRIGHLSKSRLA